MTGRSACPRGLLCAPTLSLHFVVNMLVVVRVLRSQEEAQAQEGEAWFAQGRWQAREDAEREGGAEKAQEAFEQVKIVGVDECMFAVNKSYIDGV